MVFPKRWMLSSDYSIALGREHEAASLHIPEIRYNTGSERIMKKSLILLTILGALLAPTELVCQGGQDISSTQAFRMLDQPATYLVDVRTVAEYVYVGHPDMAHNIPLVFWDEQNLQTVANEQFVEDMKARFKLSDTVIIICRSGIRSPHARRMLRSAGFQKVFNVTEGFEGKKDQDGHRIVDGWKNQGLPYTYQLDPALLHRPKK